MRVSILGCGGSLGVPLVGNVWGQCDPENPRNRRRRPSVLIETERARILVDTTPDCRQQLLDAGVRRLDAVLFTHDHADHIHGLDDLRPLTYRQQGPIAAFADEPTAASLERRFGYAVDTVDVDRGLYKPILRLSRIDGPFEVGDVLVRPFLQRHGKGVSLGFRFDRFAYSTDVSELDPAAFDALRGVRVWVVDACREEPHMSHAHVAKAVDWIRRVRPERAYLTHMNHTLDYETLRRKLPAGVEPAFDGLVIHP